MRYKFSWSCFFKGHKVADYTDSGYHICERCKCHEYYDGSSAEWDGERNYWDFTLPTIWIMRKQIIIWKFEKLISRLYRRCPDCKKGASIFRKDVGDHSKCLPF